MSGKRDDRTTSFILASFPLLVATTICGSLSLDESHNWYDTLAGAAIGILSALAAYRTRYAAIWDFRLVASPWQICRFDDPSFNHIPLPRSTFKVKIDDPQQDVPSPPVNAEKRLLPENPPQLEAPFLPPMTFLTPTNEKSLPSTPAQSFTNVTVHMRSADGQTGARVGGMETVIEEGGVGNAEVQPEEQPKRKFRFRRQRYAQNSSSTVTS